MHAGVVSHWGRRGGSVHCSSCGVEFANVFARNAHVASHHAAYSARTSMDSDGWVAYVAADGAVLVSTPASEPVLWKDLGGRPDVVFVGRGDDAAAAEKDA